jgi:hypothetical protein
MINTSKRDPFLCRYKVGFNDDGRIIAMEMEYFNDGMKNVRFCSWALGEECDPDIVTFMS